MQKPKLQKYRSMLNERLVMAASFAEPARGAPRLSERDQALLEEIQAALERIEAGSFGICAKCGQELADRRLELRPVARHCRLCKAPPRCF